jgi:hypothetical protein
MLALFLATVVILALVGVTAWLAAAGIDAAPVMDVVTGSVAAASGLLTLALTLANRATAAKTERNVDALGKSTSNVADAVFEVADAMPRPRMPSRHADPDDTLLLENRRAAPAPQGS